MVVLIHFFYFMDVQSIGLTIGGFSQKLNIFWWPNLQRLFGQRDKVSLLSLDVRTLSEIYLNQLGKMLKTSQWRINVIVPKNFWCHSKIVLDYVIIDNIGIEHSIVVLHYVLLGLLQSGWTKLSNLFCYDKVNIFRTDIPL